LAPVVDGPDPAARRVGVVTGAASGIGRAVVERMRSEGWSVVAADRTEAARTTAGDDDLVGCVADVATEAGNAAVVTTALERFGRLDGIVLNAGVGGAGPLETQPLEELDRMLAVNLRGVILGVRAALPALREHGAGSIVVTASISGLSGDPGMWAYNASKGGVVNFVRSAAIDLAPEGIRVNAVCPGGIAGTGMTRPMERHAPELFEEMRTHVPMLRWGSPEEVAAAVTFLLSPDASFVTGVALPVDGGVSAGTGQFRNPAGRRSAAG
jgi:meso-butanediol dehydrogenase / (S,S)-butanediol dehydrogenase / diacetyl reductase